MTEEEAGTSRQEANDSSMLDVHPVHNSIHGWRDFLLHLLTITIGLFIALSLEGLVEWQHHRSLVHDAQASMREEIRSNANRLNGADADIKNEQATLKADVNLLKQIIKTGKTPANGNIDISFKIRGFDNLSWKAAQSTNALSYMSYATAKEYAEIYDMQEKFETAQAQAARDAIVSLAPFINLSEKESPVRADVPSMKQHVEILQAQLLLLDSLVTELKYEYKKFLAAHPGE
ncbi:MAG TPA: hypothetical protein VJO35_01495 [Terriglobales bacterium]|nr:hypothetical protein [Terriglobales bacterium]